MQEWYHWWWTHKKMTKKQIQKMVDNMRKSWDINRKSNDFHKKEEKEAEDILKQLDNM